ncbi:MAG: hypothetical protein QOG73_3493, partial [Acetobacteraceae bacterium]|nr:hypothetical protein [Acetobacteraceae bacterium]
IANPKIKATTYTAILPIFTCLFFGNALKPMDRFASYRIFAFWSILQMVWLVGALA